MVYSSELFKKYNQWRLQNDTEPLATFLIEEVTSLSVDYKDLSQEMLTELKKTLCLIVSENLKMQLNQRTTHLQQELLHLRAELESYPNTHLRCRTWFVNQ